MSIRSKIFLSFLVVVVLMLASLASVFFFHLGSLVEYKKVSDNLVHENELSQKTIALVETYNAVMLAPSSNERKSTYRSLKDDINGILDDLEDSIESEDSKVIFEGLSKIVREILADTDAGLTELERNNVQSASERYSSAIYKRGFVEEVATALVLAEVKYLQDIQGDIERRYQQQLLLMIVWVGVVLGIVLTYSIIFARRITAPISVLSLASQAVSNGEYEHRIEHDLVERTDEVGLLARSFNLMLETLNIKIRQVESANSTIMKTKKDLEQRNAELERFNRMVVNRELKMVSLKEENERLKAQLQDRQ